MKVMAVVFDPNTQEVRRFIVAFKKLDMDQVLRVPAAKAKFFRRLEKKLRREHDISSFKDNGHDDPPQLIFASTLPDCIVDNLSRRRYD